MRQCETIREQCQQHTPGNWTNTRKIEQGNWTIWALRPLWESYRLYQLALWFEIDSGSLKSANVSCPVGKNVTTNAVDLNYITRGALQRTQLNIGYTRSVHISMSSRVRFYALPYLTATRVMEWDDTRIPSANIQQSVYVVETSNQPNRYDIPWSWLARGVWITWQYYLSILSLSNSTALRSPIRTAVRTCRKPKWSAWYVAHTPPHHHTNMTQRAM